MTGRSIPGAVPSAPQFLGRGRQERPVTGRARGPQAHSNTTVPQSEHGSQAGMHSGPHTGADSHQPREAGERNSINDGRRQLLPKQLQPVAVTTTASTITHDTIRDIVGFSSPRQSLPWADDTSSRPAASNRSPCPGDGLGCGRPFPPLARAATCGCTDHATGAGQARSALPENTRLPSPEKFPTC